MAQPDPAGTQSDATQIPGRVVELEIAEFEFRAENRRVRPGTTVRWTNRDPVPHTVTPDDEDATWGSVLIGPGETFEWKFDTEGSYSYHCEPHPFMKAGIVVARRDPAAHFGSTLEDRLSSHQGPLRSASTDPRPIPGTRSP